MATGLTTIVITVFLKVFTDSSGNHPITVYRPQCPPGYCALGDYAQGTTAEEPNYGVTLCLKADDGSSLLSTPAGYRRVRSSENEENGSGRGSGSESFNVSSEPKSVNFWRAIPPSDDYAAIGDVVTTGAEQPPRDLICVVHKSIVAQAARGRRIWLNQSGSSSVWSTARSHRHLDLQTFVTNKNKNVPNIEHFWSLIPEVLPAPTIGHIELRTLRSKDLNLIYRDHGSKAYEDLSIYVSHPPIGFTALGYYAEKGWVKSPGAQIKVVKEVGSSILLANPVKYRKVWYPQTKAFLSCAIWRPIPSPGYTCMGDVVTILPTEVPSTNSIVCLHSSLLERSHQGSRVWWNRLTRYGRSKYPLKDMTLWRAESKQDCESPNTLVANLGFGTLPSEKFLFHCLPNGMMEM